MGTEGRALPVLPLSFGLFVIVVVLLGRWIFGIEWDADQLALTLVGVILLGAVLVLAGRRILD